MGGLQVQISTAETPELELILERISLGIDSRLLFLPLSRNRSRLWENKTINHRARSPDRGGKAESVSEGDVALIDDFLMSTMTRAAEHLRADFERREPRSRICRDESVRVLVNKLLDWQCPDHPGPWQDSRGHLRRYPA